VKVKILEIHNDGGAAEEYIDLKVTEACDLKFYLVGDTTYNGEKTVSNKLRHTFWFTPQAAVKGDFVRLYTRPQRSGDVDSWQNGSKTTTYVFYWGLATAVWNNTGDCALLYELNAWDTKKT
jgi:hypothetical protein